MTQPTTRIEDVWAAKGNLADNAVVLDANGKYPALDGSLITNVGDLVAANNLSELTATASTARTNLELGASDAVEFGEFIPPSGTTTEIDAVTTATIGSVMWDTDKQHSVRFVTASTYVTLNGGGNLYLNDPDNGATDFTTHPQSWTIGGIIVDNPLGTTEPIAIKGKGWHRVTMNCTASALSPPQTAGDITVNVSGTAKIQRWAVDCSQYLPTPTVMSRLSAATAPVSSYVFDYTDASQFSPLATATKASLVLSVDIYNDTEAEVLVTYTYDSPSLYVAFVIVESIEVHKID